MLVKTIPKGNEELFVVFKIKKRWLLDSVHLNFHSDLDLVTINLWHLNINRPQP